jgi:hypothetical protein
MVLDCRIHTRIGVDEKGQTFQVQDPMRHFWDCPCGTTRVDLLALMRTVSHPGCRFKVTCSICEETMVLHSACPPGSPLPVDPEQDSGRRSEGFRGLDSNEVFEQEARRKRGIDSRDEPE